MPEGEPHPSTMPGFRRTKNPGHAVTCSRSGRKKKIVEFEDVQPQSIPNPTQENFPRKCIIQLPDGVSHIYYTGKELTVPYDDTWSILSNAKQLRPNIAFSHIKSGNVSIAHLRTYLTIAADREYDITIPHTFIFFMMRHLRFQTANGTIPLGYHAAVADLDSAAQYDWGSAILASLYHGLDTAVTTGGAITGFFQLLTYWFYVYCGVGHPIVKEDVKYHIDHRTIETFTWKPWLESEVSEIEDALNAKLLSRKGMPLKVPNGNCEYYLGDRCWRQLEGEAHIPLDPSLSMSPHISPAALHEMRQVRFLDCEQFVVGEERETYASYWTEQTSEVGHMLTDSKGMGNIDLFGPTALKAGIILVVVMSASVHSASQDISLPGEAEWLDLGTEELWHLTHGMRRLVLTESARDEQRFKELEDELAIAHRQIDSIDHQLYVDDLQLRRGCDVREVPLPPGGGARTRQRGSVRQTREGGTNRRGWGTGDDSE
ncbi:hypothetical protein GIB67_040918 [Kingdonia uniflora]|uniref:Aminotransferase-like plant mobile domain-containing protein n=1 Tax=Kingdonia uniflora TaxID=39325 RepID=A0A7J7PCI6_9MAGN|nr:hypothetical protein GIB67_040918 [Kingdonia uniflora]